MKTEDLKKQGLTDEQIQFVFAENGKDISALQTENATLKAEKATLENEKKVLEKEKTEKDKTIQDYQKNSITKDEYNKQVKEIEDNAKREREEYIFNGILSKALDDNKVLSDEKTRKAFETLLDKDTLKISDDQKSIIGLKEQLDTLKKDVPHFFSSKAEGASPANPDSDGGKGDDGKQVSEAINFAKEANKEESQETKSQFFN